LLISWRVWNIYWGETIDYLHGKVLLSV